MLCSSGLLLVELFYRRLVERSIESDELSAGFSIYSILQ